MKRIVLTVVLAGALASCVHLKQTEAPRRIYHAANAPTSVRLAAQELQRVIEIATGEKLPIVHEPASPMIALSDTGQIDVSGLPDDGFVIRTRGADLFIAGRDDSDSKQTPQPGYAPSDLRISRGTLLGAYTFLEKYLDVRWLLPGPLGEDIPKRPAWRLPRINLTESPDFQMRRLVYIQESGHGAHNPGHPAVDEWVRRQKLGGTLLLQMGHSWDEFMPPTLLKEHPEWLAVGGDKDKFCTSREDAVRAFADGVIRNIEQHPDAPVISISPADGPGLCRCDRCRPLIEKDPHGNDSFSYLILKFYNDVARLVAAKHPDKLLCGLVYFNYQYPPQRPITLEPNVALNWAHIDYYGYALYKPKYRQEFARVAREWARLTRHFSYQSYTVWLRSSSGTPTPPSLDLLSLEIPTIHRLGGEGLYLIGAEAWGYGAPINYLYAKLAWDGDLDVRRTYEEWLRRAYGPGWQSMRDLFAMLDDAIRQYKLTETALRNYEVTYETVRDVYVPLVGRMETLYQEALRRAATEPQRKRLEMFGANLAQLRENLRQAGLLNVPPGPTAPPTESFAIAKHPQPVWAPETRTLTIPRLPAGVAAPTIDGAPADAAWQHAVVADAFRVRGTRVPGTKATTARLVYDDRYLYVAFDCAEPKPDEIVGQSWPRDAARFYHADDVVEVFFSHTHDRNQWWHLATNLTGAQCDSLKHNAAYNLEWTCAARTNNASWTAEFRIPFATLGLKEAPAGAVWFGNLTREERPANEYTSWNSVEGHFAEPNNFGEWRFAP